MPRPEESFKHTETAYKRPNQAYLCGHECDGKSCALRRMRRVPAAVTSSPKTGAMRANASRRRGSTTASPVRRTTASAGHCGRDPSRGGPCKDGPRPDGSCCLQLTPCSPAASLRHRRGRAAILLAALSFAFVLLLFANRPASPDHPLNPGHLSAAHSTAGMTCASCHDNADGAPGFLPDFHSDRAFLDAHRCIDCHQEIGGEGGAEMFNAHTLPQAHLSELTEKAEQRGSSSPSLMLTLASRLGADAGRIACASCHKEHQGTGADLKHLSNAQCQVCHSEQFDSFSHGHPEFTAYPYRRRTRIFFDHDTHFREYFKTEEFKGYAKQACAECHTEQADGGIMLTKSFANTCADCHDSNTKFGSWNILAFPKVDSRRIEDQLGADTMAKLEAFSSASAREISPLLRLLLAEEQAPALFPLRKATEEEKSRAAEITRALLDGVFASDGKAGLSEALDSSPLLEGSNPEDARRLRNLGDIFASLKATAKAEPVASKTDFGGSFSYDPSSGAFAYAPGGHADPLMKAVLDVAASKAGKLPHAREVFGAASDFWQGIDTTGAGKCLKCHTLDSGDDGSMRINWAPAAADPSSRPITKFRHSSHIRLPEMIRENEMQANASCASCHQLETSPDKVDAYREQFSAENHNPHRFRSGFQNLLVNNCAQCHTEERAGDSCLQCHQYHATPSPLTPAIGSLVSNGVKPANDTPNESGDAPTPDTDTDTGDGDLLVPDAGGEDGG